MENLNRELEISTGTHRGFVKNHLMTWGSIVEMLSDVKRKKMTTAEYQALTKDERDREKAGLFFAGGHYKDGVRHVVNIDARSMLTLDLDEITDLDLVETLKLGIFPDLDAEAFVYSSRSHTADAPRLRIVLPLMRQVDPVEFAHLSRMVADKIDPGLKQTDPASARRAQIMYLPSVNSDGEFISVRIGGTIIDPDAWLAGVDLNLGSDKLFPGEREMARASGGRILGDPRDKRGIVGAFCRVYSISRALSELLPGVYTPTTVGRYSYAAGTTTDGVQTYDDTFLYSWHKSDPATERSLNAFDLVRIHKFGGLDTDVPPGTAINRLPSYAAMIEEFGQDQDILEEWKDRGAPKVTKVTAADFGDDFAVPAVAEAPVTADAPAFEPDFAQILSVTADDFDIPVVVAPAVETAAVIGFEDDGIDALLAADPDASNAWQDRLTYTSKKDAKGVIIESKVDATENNISIILQNDPVTGGAIAFDEFQGRMVQMKPIIFPNFGAASFPLRRGKPVEVTDALVRGVLTWLQSREMDGGWELKPRKEVVVTAVQAASDTDRFDSLVDLITSTEWDGVERMETFLTDYTDCEDNIYSREVSRLFLLGMVVRAMEPGHKFDNMLILEGKQGLRKTTFVKRIGMGLMSTLREGDLKTTKLIIEKTLGVWVCELGELAAMQNITGEQISAFLSDTKDTERMSFQRFSETFQRRAVFIGTTNSREPYLLKQTGNRRFWPIVVRKMIDTDAVRDVMPQVIAEALNAYRQMRHDLPDLDRELNLDMSHDAKVIAEAVQLSRTRIEEEDLSARVAGWLMKPADPNDSRADWTPGAIGAVAIAGREYHMRKLFMTGQIWADVMGKDGIPDLKEATRIGKALQHMPYLSSSGAQKKSCRRFGQKAYKIVDLEALAREIERSAAEQGVPVEVLLG